MKKAGVRVIRTSEPNLDALHHTCDVKYHLVVIRDNSLVDEVEEKHVVRYFFPEEIRHYLKENGFKLLKLCPFPNLDAEISADDWNVAAVSRAV